MSKIEIGDMPLGWAYVRRFVVWHISHDDSSVHNVATLCGKSIRVDGWTRGAWSVQKLCNKCRGAYVAERAQDALGHSKVG